MDFIPLTDTDTPEQSRSKRIRVLGGSAISLGLGSVLPVLALTGGWLAAGPVVGLVAVVSLLSAFPVGIYALTASGDMEDLKRLKRRRAIRIALGRHYGLELSLAEFDALNYPESKPTEAFRVYGSMLRVERASESSFVERKVYLVSMDGELQLASSKDGKRFKELLRARPELPAASARPELPSAPTRAQSASADGLDSSSISA